MEFSSADLCKLSLQEVADLLLDKLEDDVDRDSVGCIVYGCNGERMFSLELCMKEVVE
jgi:hypothetical protein